LGKEKYGAFRDEANDLHVVSATCTHLGCTIRWNSDEMSWDCPCHGSRFSYDGKVLNGPAIEELLYFKENAAASSIK
jgi:Rieske Fe-S protein